jgi:hypothetical protein
MWRQSSRAPKQRPSDNECEYASDELNDDSGGGQVHRFGYARREHLSFLGRVNVRHIAERAHQPPNGHGPPKKAKHEGAPHHANGDLPMAYGHR